MIFLTYIWITLRAFSDETWYLKKALRDVDIKYTSPIHRLIALKTLSFNVFRIILKTLLFGKFILESGYEYIEEICRDFGIFFECIRYRWYLNLKLLGFSIASQILFCSFLNWSPFSDRFHRNSHYRHSYFINVYF